MSAYIGQTIKIMAGNSSIKVDRIKEERADIVQAFFLSVQDSLERGVDRRGDALRANQHETV